MLDKIKIWLGFGKDHQTEYLEKEPRVDYSFERMFDDQEPTMTREKDKIRWHVNGAAHRIGAPAIIYNDGMHLWYHRGLCHRNDGPAIQDRLGREYWYFRDTEYSFDDWLKANDEIDEQDKTLLKLKYG